MKKALLLLFLALITGCTTTERIYVIILPQEETVIVPVTEAVRHTHNRFTKQFHASDSLFSVFEKASDEAMKSAIEKTVKDGSD